MRGIQHQNYKMENLTSHESFVYLGLVFLVNVCTVHSVQGRKDTWCVNHMWATGVPQIIGAVPGICSYWDIAELEYVQNFSKVPEVFWPSHISKIRFP